MDITNKNTKLIVQTESKQWISFYIITLGNSGRELTTV